MKMEDFLEQLKEEFDLIKTEDDLMAFLKRTELTLIKSQMLCEMAENPLKFLQENKS